MLSNTNPQTVNRRQNSNPDIYQFADPLIVLPTQPRQYQNIASKGHRRGQSLDPRLFSQSPRPRNHQEASNSVSMTNQGQYPSQQTMQEPQTLGLDRPGRDIQQQLFEQSAPSGLASLSGNIYHPQPQHTVTSMHNLKHFEMVDSSKFAPFPDPSENPFNISMSNEFADASNGLEIHKEPFIQSTQVFSNPKAISSQRTNLDMSDEQSRRGSVQPFQSMPTTCPSTPMKQNKTSHLMTPAATPQHKLKASTSTIKHESTHSIGLDGDPFATIKACQVTPIKKELSYQDNFAGMRRGSAVEALDANEASWPTPPNTAPMPSRYFHAMPTVGRTFGLIDFTQPVHHYSSSNSSFDSSPDMKYETSPEVAAMEFFEDFPREYAIDAVIEPNNDGAPNSEGQCLNYNANIQHIPIQPMQNDKPVAVTLGEAVIGNQVPTDIAPEEIAAFIGGPDHNGEWVCLYPKCNRPFKRKENIKSHIQTHLNDRQYVCMVCPARFVRPHDLKRHENIHSESKPFSCPCSKRFNRHDALTRHRQRDTCIGGVGGIAKPKTKRGRPKKASRPDSEERREKAARTRQRAMEKAAARASGTSSSASSQPAMSPPAMFEDLSIKGSTPDPMENPPILQSTTEFFNMSFTPPTSPSHYSTGDRFTASPDHAYESFAASPMSSIPELELGSSPSATQSFDELFVDDHFASVPKGEFGGDEDLFSLAEGWSAVGTL